GANGALLVFDSVNYPSFYQLDFWYEKLIENAVDSKIPIILVGSKSDLIDKTTKSEIIAEELISNYLEERKLEGFYKTSALENHNVLEVFKELNNLMLKRLKEDYIVI
ncbi:MAG: hypothetical protein ACFE9Q_06625, partial [Candidatus Hodarchaeota archaeon]